jgi:hypothetical protein
MLDAQHGNMGASVGYFYAGVTFAIAVSIFLLVPETASPTLEQIDQFFNLGAPAWKSSVTGKRKIAQRREQEMQAAE